MTFCQKMTGLRLKQIFCCGLRQSALLFLQFSSPEAPPVPKSAPAPLHGQSHYLKPQPYQHLPDAPIPTPPAKQQTASGGPEPHKGYPAFSGLESGAKSHPHISLRQNILTRLMKPAYTHNNNLQSHPANKGLLLKPA